MHRSVPLGLEPTDRPVRRRRVAPARTVAVAAAAAIGVLAIATRDGDDAAPASTVTTTATGPTSSAPVWSTPSSSSTTTSPPTTTATAGAAVPCELADIVTDTGVELAALMGGCHAGWALAITPDCGGGSPEDGGECESADAFHITTDGWRRVGSVYPFCVDPLVEATGMTVATAVAFGAEACDPASSVDLDAAPVTLRPGDASPEIRALQIALVSEGYDIAADGEYGPATEAAVRDLQRARDLPVDGIADPATRAALEV